ncbi:SMC-Scp complex subunit ScpB [Candidatus Nomurabacteria bacterium]|jgi:segregation and condensation protein B|nr:MAG: SMC-Scp complex subunit ScpB [Candidatus Nomurabacteria bacterium]
MEITELVQKIEALLFIKGQTLSLGELVTLTREPKSKIAEACSMLQEKHRADGIVVIFNNEEIALGTNPLLASFLDQIRKEELEKELSKASVETLAIILYKKNVTRAEIDYIRGVNSSFILRALLIRGLIEKESHPEDSRKFMYTPSLDLMRFLGITSLEELSDKASVEASLQTFVQNSAQEIEQESV